MSQAAYPKIFQIGPNKPRLQQIHSMPSPCGPLFFSPLNYISAVIPFILFPFHFEPQFQKIEERLGFVRMFCTSTLLEELWQLSTNATSAIKLQKRPSKLGWFYWIYIAKRSFSGTWEMNIGANQSANVANCLHEVLNSNIVWDMFENEREGITAQTKFERKSTNGGECAKMAQIWRMRGLLKSFWRIFWYLKPPLFFSFC